MTVSSRHLPVRVTVDGELQPIFDRFLDIQRGQIKALIAALRVGDRETVALLAHTIRGSAATYQLPDTAAVAAELEALARTGDLAGAILLAEGLGRYFARLQVVFRDGGETAGAAVAAPPEKS